MLTLNRNQIQLFLAIALLVPVFMYWILQTDADQDSSDAPPITSGVDYFMKQVNVREFSTAGHLVRTLNASELNHFPEKQGSTLTTPKIAIHRPDSSRINIQSNKGFSSDTAQSLQLDEAVVVTHNSTFEAPTELTTSSLTLLHLEGIAKTDAPIEIRQNGHITTATGMIINYNTGVSELLSDVKGTFYADQ